MTTVIIDTRSKEAKKLLDYLKTIKYVRIIDKTPANTEDNDPEFVEMINERKNQPAVKLDIKNLWK